MTAADQVRRFYDEIWNIPDTTAIPARRRHHASDAGQLITPREHDPRGRRPVRIQLWPYDFGGRCR